MTIPLPVWDLFKFGDRVTEWEYVEPEPADRLPASVRRNPPQLVGPAGREKWREGRLPGDGPPIDLDYRWFGYERGRR